MYSAFTCFIFCSFCYCTVVQNIHPFVPKNSRKLRNVDDPSQNDARQAERRGIAQTMESRVRYGTHTRLDVVLYTSRVPLFAVLCQPSWRMDDDTTRGTSIFLGLYCDNLRVLVQCLTLLVSVVRIYRWTGHVSHIDIPEQKQYIQIAISSTTRMSMPYPRTEAEMLDDDMFHQKRQASAGRCVSPS